MLSSSGSGWGSGGHITAMEHVGSLVDGLSEASRDASGGTDGVTDKN